MADEGAAGWRGERDRAEEGPAERGPGAAFHMFVLMEDLLDKLKLLSYEEEAMRRHNMRPLSRHYFALPTNSGEQFFMFCTLAAWLISKAGHPFEQPQECDDPNAVISNVLSELPLQAGSSCHTAHFPDCCARLCLAAIQPSTLCWAQTHRCRQQT